ncbi:MAG: cytochrome P450, partial [Actinomycetota bacterium]
EAAGTLFGIAAQLAAERRANPGDDLISAIVESDVEGGLDDHMIASIFLLFAVAGNDTTRNSTSHGLKLLADHPDQWRAVKADPGRLINPMVEEIVRYATPVIQFRRTATRGVELGGREIAEGDMVVVFYETANKDETAFENASTFDVTRDPNPHVGFGGGGPHFCLGANLARTQMRDLFTHLAAADVDIEAGDPRYLKSHFINGIVEMPVSL